MIGTGKGEASFTLEIPGLGRFRQEAEARYHMVRPGKAIWVVAHLVAAERIEISRTVS